MRDDDVDDLDGEGDDDGGHHCLHSKKVVCGPANFSRTYRTFPEGDAENGAALAQDPGPEPEPELEPEP